MTDVVPKGGASALNGMASQALSEQLQIAESLPPSKVQNFLSELFRVALCRNDDYNLAGSSTIRATKQFAQAKLSAAGQGPLNNSNTSTAGVLQSQQKILSDLTVREEERVHRETEILKELSYMNKLSQ